jgi:hypothetical protein
MPKVTTVVTITVQGELLGNKLAIRDLQLLGRGQKYGCTYAVKARQVPISGSDLVADLSGDITDPEQAAAMAITLELAGSPDSINTTLSSLLGLVEESDCVTQVWATILSRAGVLNQDIKVLTVTHRLKGQLRRWRNINTIGELTDRRPKELYVPYKIGWSSIRDIELALLSQFGLQLKQD